MKCLIKLGFVVILLHLHKQRGKNSRNKFCIRVVIKLASPKMKILLLIIGYTTEERLIKVPTDGCVCPGDVMTYECTVFGGIGTTTVWKSDVFQCSSGKQVIELIHSTNESIIRVCNNGDIVARTVRSESDSFTSLSQLNVTLTRDIAGGSIECIGDNGTYTHRVGLLNVTATAIRG